MLKILSIPAALPGKPEGRQARLLAWILLFILGFSIATLLVVLIFNPHQDPKRDQYAMLIGGLIAFTALAYILNCLGRYHASAILLVAFAALTPWLSLLFDPSILQGDFVPLTYLTFSILLSSILLPTRVTLILAVIQFAGITVTWMLDPASASFNWFSFLAFIFLTSVFSIIANHIIQLDMKQISDQASQLAQSESQLKEQSIRDYLTNLFNRRYLEETLEREVQRVKRKQLPLGIIMLDVDRFKEINDTLGHATGDTVLQELGKLLAGQIRQSDIACRYGGDEFVLIMPEASRGVTLERAGQLLYRVKDLELPVTITVSLGVAVFPDDGASGKTVMESADAALIQAKSEGGHRAVCLTKGRAE